MILTALEFKLSKPSAHICGDFNLLASDFTLPTRRVWFSMKQFIAKNWKMLNAAKNEGAPLDKIHKLLAMNGFPGTYNTFYTYWLEVSKMTTAQRKRCAKS